MDAVAADFETGYRAAKVDILKLIEDVAVYLEHPTSSEMRGYLHCLNDIRESIQNL